MFHANGLLKVTVKECSGLKVTGLFTRIEAYAIVRIGKESYTSHVAATHGANPKWAFECQFNLQRPDISVYTDKVEIEVRNQGVFWSASVGTASVELKDLVNGTEPIQQWHSVVKIRGDADYHVGNLLLHTEYHPPMKLRVYRATGLYQAQWIGRQDPRVMLQIGGHDYLTEYCPDGGCEPVWNAEFFINPDLQYSRLVEAPKKYDDIVAQGKPIKPIPVQKRIPPLILKLSVYNVNLLFDDFLGRALVPFHSLVENMGAPMWFRLGRNANQRTPAGQLLISLHHYTQSSYNIWPKVDDSEEQVVPQIAQLQQEPHKDGGHDDEQSGKGSNSSSRADIAAAAGNVSPCASPAAAAVEAEASPPLSARSSVGSARVSPSVRSEKWKGLSVEPPRPDNSGNDVVAAVKEPLSSRSAGGAGSAEELNAAAAAAAGDHDDGQHSDSSSEANHAPLAISIHPAQEVHANKAAASAAEVAAPAAANEAVVEVPVNTADTAAPVVPSAADSAAASSLPAAVSVAQQQASQCAAKTMSSPTAPPTQQQPPSKSGVSISFSPQPATTAVPASSAAASSADVPAQKPAPKRKAWCGYDPDEEMHFMQQPDEFLHATNTSQGGRVSASSQNPSRCEQSESSVQPPVPSPRRVVVDPSDLLPESPREQRQTAPGASSLKSQVDGHAAASAVVPQKSADRPPQTHSDSTASTAANIAQTTTTRRQEDLLKMYCDCPEDDGSGLGPDVLGQATPAHADAYTNDTNTGKNVRENVRSTVLASSDSFEDFPVQTVSQYPATAVADDDELLDLDEPMDITDVTDTPPYGASTGADAFVEIEL